MLKVKRNKAMLVAMLILAMATVYGVVPVVPGANAASLTDLSDTISDSDLSQLADHTIDFTVATTLDVDDYIEIEFPAGFTGLAAQDAEEICPAGADDEFVLAASVAGQVLTCTVDIGKTVTNLEPMTMTIPDIGNPGSAGHYTITIRTYNDAGPTLRDESTLKVYIIEDVSVTAKVNATLTFGIAAVDAGETVNGVVTNGTSTSVSIPFGTLSSVSSTSIAQQLTVSTNADDGYSVTVEQDQPLSSAAGATIDSFIDASVPAGPQAWTAPGGTLDQPDEYGHMGVTTNDSDLAADFDSSKYDGLVTGTPLEVMSHDGPSNGTAQDSGLARVLYTVEITDLQEAGDHSSTLTYVCTPTY